MGARAKRALRSPEWAGGPSLRRRFPQGWGTFDFRFYCSVVPPGGRVQFNSAARLQTAAGGHSSASYAISRFAAVRET